MTIEVNVQHKDTGELLVLSELDKTCKRRASREFVHLINHVIALRMSKKPDAKTFEEICYKVHWYKLRYFRILAANQLLRDDDACDNPFESDLLVELNEVAKQHTLRSELIPHKFPYGLIKDVE